MKNIATALLLFFTGNISAQYSEALTGVIRDVKKGVLPLFCHDSTWTKQVYQSGSCVALGSLTKMCFLTCEHTVAIKDSMRKTKRYASDYYVQVNNQNDSAFETVQLKLIYTDEKRDFALLAPDEKQQAKAFPYIRAFQPTLWKETKELNEGETVLYMGYPVILGRDKANHPVSKTTMISQLVKGQNTFLIDGYVDVIHSGSPIFAVQKDSIATGRWTYSLVGIAASFPPEFGHIYESLNSDELQYKWTLLNPGFTNVISMNEITPVLRRLGY